MGKDWGGTGEGSRKGRSVHEQPGAKVDGIAPHERRDSKYVKGDWKGNQRGASKGSKRWVCAIAISSICICVYNDCLNVINNLNCV
jgi:hypothetical protein